MSAGV